MLRSHGRRYFRGEDSHSWDASRETCRHAGIRARATFRVSRTLTHARERVAQRTLFGRVAMDVNERLG